MKEPGQLNREERFGDQAGFLDLDFHTLLLNIEQGLGDFDGGDADLSRFSDEADGDQKRLLATTILQLIAPSGDAKSSQIQSSTLQNGLGPLMEKNLPSVGGRFQFGAKLGSGGMGTVFEVFDQERQATLAMKILQHPIPSLLLGFKHEFRALTDLAHPNLVRLYEFFHEGNLFCFTMERIYGTNLVTWWESLVKKDPGGQPPYHLLRKAFIELSNGLHFLHADGKLHRDIKPSNVMVREDNRVAVLDFGLVTNFADSLGLFNPEGWNFAGTIPYMPPEQMAGENLDVSSDWYAFGVLLYEVLAGKAPFYGPYALICGAKESESYKSLPDSVPRDLRQLCGKLLRSDPRQRPTLPEIQGVLQDSGRISGSLGLLPQNQATRFVGRALEIEVLQRAYRLSISGKPVLALVHGHSGMGKSSLLNHFQRELEIGGAEKALILAGRCYEQESIPYKGFDEIIDQLSVVLMQMSKEKVQEILPKDFPILASAFPVLNLGPEYHQISLHSPDEISDPAAKRRRMLVAFRYLLIALSRENPIVLMIDDLQWCDPGCISIVETILAISDHQRILMIGSFRRKEADQNEELVLLRQQVADSDQLTWFDIPVDELDQDSLLDLAGEFCRESPEKVDLDRIVGESKGVPYFLMQLATAAARGEEATTLDTIFLNRLNELDEDERRFLEMVAVAGRPVERGFAIKTANLTSNEHLIESNLRTGRWIKSTGPGLGDAIETYHDRIREGLLDQMEPGVRKGHHYQLAYSLESLGVRDNENLAFHYLGAGHEKTAGGYYALAAEDASRSMAFTQAADFYTKSLTCQNLSKADHERIRLEELRAQALSNSGRSANSAAAFSSLAANPGVDSHGRVIFLRRSAYEYLISGYVSEGSKALNEVLSASGIHQPKSPQLVFLSLLWNQFKLAVRGLSFRQRDEKDISKTELEAIDALWAATIGYSMADVIRATNFQVQCTLRSLKAGELSRAARALAHQAIHSAPPGPKSQQTTARFLALAHQLANQTGISGDRGMAELATGAVALMEGRYRECYDCSLEALNHFQSQGEDRSWQLGAARTYQIWSLISSGEVAELRKVLPDILGDAEDRGDLHARASHKSYAKPLLLMWEDRPLEAIKTRDEAINSWPAAGFYAQHLVAMIARAEAMLYMGDPGGALQFLKDLEPEYRRSFLQRISYGHMTLLYVKARCISAACQSGEAPVAKSIRRIRSINRKIRSLKQPCSGAMVDCLEGSILRIQGKPASALICMKRSANRFNELDMKLHWASILWAMNEASDTEETRRDRRVAKEWFESQGIVNPQRTSLAYCP